MNEMPSLTSINYFRDYVPVLKRIHFKCYLTSLIFVLMLSLIFRIPNERIVSIPPLIILVGVTVVFLLLSIMYFYRSVFNYVTSIKLSDNALEIEYYNWKFKKMVMKTSLLQITLAQKMQFDRDSNLIIIFEDNNNRFVLREGSGHRTTIWTTEMLSMVFSFFWWNQNEKCKLKLDLKDKKDILISNQFFIDQLESAEAIHLTTEQAMKVFGKYRL